MAGPGSLSSMPPELVIRIFQHCDSFADLRALLLTCRSIHAVWVANGVAVARHLAPEVIPAFDQALMAVRAVRRVLLAAVHAPCKLMVNRRCGPPPSSMLLIGMAFSPQRLSSKGLPTRLGRRALPSSWKR
jgi:hypothetical protein